MGTITQYALQVAFLLAAFYLIYRWTLAGCTFCRFNRVVLICGYAVAFLTIPIWKMIAEPSSIVTDGLNVEMLHEEITALTNNPAPEWPALIAAIYLSGVAIATVLTCCSIYKIGRTIKRSEKTKKRGYTLAFTSQKHISPFNWGRYIVLPADTEEDDISIIETHERSHLRHRHWIDLALGQLVIIFNWFNPAAYLMVKELQDVHEFEADRDVVKSGIDEKQYQMLLVRNVSGSLFPILADSLNHSQLKTRLKVMLSNESNPFRKISIALSIPAIVFATIALNSNAMASCLSTIAGASLISSDYNEVAYVVDGKKHSIIYAQDGLPTMVSMEVESGVAPSIFINRHIASKEDLRNIKSDDVIFLLGDNTNNRFILKTK